MTGGSLSLQLKKQLKQLATCNVIYMDGTFKSCPFPYQQFVAIHGKYQGHVFPFVMYLAYGKDVATYRQILAHIKAKISCKILHHTGHQQQPEQIVCDFEHVIVLALETEHGRLQAEAAAAAALATDFYRAV